MSSLGGPLALAALAAPGLLGDASGASGAAMLGAIAIFLLPLVIWLRYSRTITGSAGLTGFVEAAAGRRVALVQAGIWILSYFLYLIYTTVQIVYDVLPAIVAGERHYQTWLALGIPVAMAGVMIAGRTPALVVIGLIAAVQVGMAGVLAGVTLAHLPLTGSTFDPAPAGAVAKASAQTSLLYVCGSLPLFLGGELARPSRTVRRGLGAAYALTGLIVILAVAPLASLPGVLGAAVPGVSLAARFSGAGLATAIGLGVAVSTVGVMLCEYLALSRLLHALGGWRMRRVMVVIGAIVVVAAPFSLSHPDSFYSALFKPSLVALWVSQLFVVAVYPLFVRRQRRALAPAVALSLAASGLLVYGLWTSLQAVTS